MSPANASRRARGFTLIELVAVLVILGSLSAAAVPTLLDLRLAARDAVLTQDRAMYIANIGCVYALLDSAGNIIDDGTGGDALYVGYDPLGIFLNGGLVPGPIWARRHITLFPPSLQFYGTPR